MQNLIVDLQYFAPVIIYKKLTDVSNVIFEQYEHFEKMSFRNRAVVAGANGPVNLSIPMEQGRNQKTLVKDVRISNRENWQARHWKTILSAYNRSPYLEYFVPGLEDLYKQQFDFLWDWNLACFEWTNRQIKLPVAVNFSSVYQPLYDETAYVDWRGKILPKSRLASSQYPLYRQVFEERLGFLPNLSVLDLLFCQGNRAIQILLEA